MNGPNIEERLDRVETHVRNIDLRLQHVEQILPTLATKDDLKGMPTVDDPKGFATRDDLKGMPTVDDPKGFVTKDDLKVFATKEDLKAFATKEDLKAFATKEELRAELRNYPTRAEVDAMFLREGEAMRAFVLEVVEKSSADLRNDMRVLFEQQRAWFFALTDKLEGVREYVLRAEAESKARDGMLEQRIGRLERR